MERLNLMSEQSVELLPDEIILLDSEVGKKLGFTSDRFLEMSYLWSKGADVFVSFIASKEQGKGYFKQLVERIESLGYRVLVPIPLEQMEAILKHWDWIEESIYDEDFEDYVEVWHRDSQSEVRKAG